MATPLLFRRNEAIATKDASYWEALKFGLSETSLGQAYTWSLQSSDRWDPDFDPIDYANKRGGDYIRLLETFPDRFGFAKNAEQFDAMVEVALQKEQMWRQLSNSSFGKNAIFFGTAMLADPLNLIPLYTSWKVVKGGNLGANVLRNVGRGALVFGSQFGAVSAVDEALRYSADPTMSGEDAIENTVIGALIGAGFGAVGGAVVGRKIARYIDEAAKTGDYRAVDGDYVVEGHVPDTEFNGADPGGYWENGAFRGPVKKMFEHYDPEGRLINSPFETARKFAGQFFSHGLITKAAAEGVSPAPGGTAEDFFHASQGILHTAIDVSYAEYLRYLGKSGDTMAAQTKMAVEGLKQKYLGFHADKMSPNDFLREVTRVLYTGQPSEIEHVNKAAEAFRKSFDEIFKLANKYGLLDEGEYIQNYFPLLFDPERVAADPYGFREVAKKYVKRFIEKNFYAKLDKYEGIAKQLEEIANLASDPNKLDKTLATLEDVVKKAFQVIIEEAPTFRKLGIDFITPRNLGKGSAKRFKQALGKLKRAMDDLPELMHDEMVRQSIKEKEAIVAELEAKRKKTKLARGEGKLLREEKKYLRDLKKALLERFRRNPFYSKLKEVLETQGVDEFYKTVNTILNDGDKVVAELDRLLNHPLYEQYSKVKDWLKLIERETKQIRQPKDKLEALARREARLNETIDNVLNDITSYAVKRAANDRSRLLGEIKRALQNADNLAEADGVINKLVRKKKGKEAGFIRRVWNTIKNEYRDELDDAYARLAEVRAKIDEWGPEAVGKRREKLLRDLQKKINEFTQLAEREFEEIREQIVEALILTSPEAQRLGDDVLKAQAEELLRARSVDELADLFAKQLTNKITGVKSLRGLEIQIGKRKSELGRVLFRDADWEDVQKYIINQADIALRAYARTLLSDIALKRSFGAITPEKILNQLQREYYQAEEQLRATIKDEAELKRAGAKLNDRYQRARKDIEAVWDRIRGLRGFSRALGDPDSRVFRIAEALSHYETTTKLGRVLIPSLGDAFKAIMRTGILKNFRVAYEVLIGDMKKEFRNLRNQARQAGIVETLLALRSDQLAGEIEDYISKYRWLNAWRNFSRNFIYATGLPSWTQYLKELAVITTMAEFNDLIIELAKTGKVASNPRLGRVLINRGIDAEVARRIMSSFRPDDIRRNAAGTFFPDPATWIDREAADAYRAFLRGEADQKIITPTMDRPLWTDANAIARLLYKFRGFNIASTKKYMAAGMQDPSIPFVSSVAWSIAIAFPLTYLRALAIGGEYLDQVENWSAERWFDEAVDMSGILGIISDVNRMAILLGGPSLTATYWLQGGGERLSRFAGQDALLYAFGPAGSTLNNVGRLTADIAQLIGQGDPLDPSFAHTFRTMFPGQNLIGVSYPFNIAEKWLQEALE